MMTKGTADLLFTGGTVVDGSGDPPRRADVAIKEGRVEAVGDLSGWTARTSLDARGLAVAPGFIDMHTHSDLSLLVNPRAESKLRQGVTTEVIGQCGFSPAPAPEERRGVVRGMFGGLALDEAIDWTWNGLGDYLEVIRDRGTSVNVIPVVGHGTLRAIAIGLERRAPAASELSYMKSLLREAMEEGAFGVSSGLVYTPSAFADTEELIALAQVAARYEGIYFTHMRGEGVRGKAAVEEALRIGRESGARVQLAHLKCDGKEVWGHSGQVLDMLVQARDAGTPVCYDSYPYTAWNTGLVQLLPAWAREGGNDTIVERLCDPATREQVRQALVEETEADPGRWEQRLICAVLSEENRPLQGLTLAAIADLRMQPAEDVVMDLLVEERAAASMVGFGMSEEDVSQFVSSSFGTLGSDANAIAPYGTLGANHPHPRAYGTFVRVLGKYVREDRTLSLESAVAKMTRLAAEQLGLTDRGSLAPGMAADVVVLDPETVGDRATYQVPHQYPSGIRWVVVNGVLELDGDRHLGNRPGRVLVRE